MNESIKTLIIKHLESEYGNEFCWAGKLDDYIRGLVGSKASNVSRRCRELVREGVLEVEYQQVEGKGPKCAKYRVIKFEELADWPPAFDPKEPTVEENNLPLNL